MTQTALPALQELQSIPQWVVWQYIPDEKGKPTKPPYNARTGHKASHSNPADWSTYEQARTTFRSGKYGGDWEGVGFVLANNGIVGGDLDGCVDKAGNISPWAMEIVRKMNTYTEISPSGTGLRFIARGSTPEALKKDLSKAIPKLDGIDKKPGIEMYQEERYITITGKHLPGTPGTIEERTNELLEIYHQYKKKAPPKQPRRQNTTISLSDYELRQKMFASKYGAEIQALWDGQIGEDESRADYQLCHYLAFWTNNDAARIESLFNQSALGHRDKWQDRADYRERTIQAAIAACPNGYDPLYNTTPYKPHHDSPSNGNGNGNHAPTQDNPPDSTTPLPNLDFYTKEENRMCYRIKGESIQLSNFTAEITAQTLVDDGVEVTRHYELATQLNGNQKQFTVSALDYEKSEWIDKELGAKACVTVGRSMKQHLLAAIRQVSDPTEETCFAHTGWRKIDGQMIFLHTGGGVGRVGHIVSCNSSSHDPQLHEPVEPFQEREGSCGSCGSCKLIRTSFKNSLSHFSLPEIQPEKKKEAIQASLRFLEITSDTITVPLYCSLWRSVLGHVDYGVHLAGQTGMGKSEMCALIQQHFGADMDSRHLPGSWLSTENALEMLMFQCKDALLVIDDFKPVGSKNEQERLHAKADGVFRRVGNSTARGRLDSRLQERPERPPRCLVLSTGEDTPKGQSAKARGIPLLMSQSITRVGTESQRKLTACQEDALAGIYAQCMTAYISWLAPQIEQIQGRLFSEIAKERNRLAVIGHARSGSNTASMLVGMHYFLKFAVAMEALSEQDSQDLIARCEHSLLKVASEAAQENREDRPSAQYIRLLVAALNSKKAYLEDISPKDDEEEKEREAIPPNSEMVGWIDGEDIYLLPEVAYKVASAMGISIRDEITTSERNLRKFLVQDKKLASTDQGKKRPMITIRKRFKGKRCEVLHLKSSTLFPNDEPEPEKNGPDTNDPTSQEHDPRDLHDPHPCGSALQADHKESHVKIYTTHYNSDTTHTCGSAPQGGQEESRTGAKGGESYNPHDPDPKPEKGAREISDASVPTSQEWDSQDSQDSEPSGWSSQALLGVSPIEPQKGMSPISPDSDTTQTGLRRKI